MRGRSKLDCGMSGLTAGILFGAWLISGIAFSADDKPAISGQSAAEVADEAAQSEVNRLVGQPAPEDWNQWCNRSPWIFLGDSNTYAGGFIAEIDARMRRSIELTLEASPSPVESLKRVRLINLGMSSETASGLSEIDHPFKRPCIHERLGKVLRMMRPGVVFVCYGMNDGIYDPPSAERMAAYRHGMEKLAAAVHESGAVLVVLTPPIFEPEPVAAKRALGPTADGRYAYFAPYQRYDDVLAQQAEWCLQNTLGAAKVVDLRSPLRRFKEHRLVDEPGFNFSNDGVHFGDQAHAIIARELLTQLAAPRELLELDLPAEELVASKRRMELRRDAYLTATGKNRPGLPAGLPPWLADRHAGVFP